MGRYGHHRTGTEFHQHEVGNPDGYGFAGQRVNGHQTGGHAFLLGGGQIRLGGAAAVALINKGGQGRIVGGGFFGQWVAGGHGHVADAHHCIGARGINFQPIVTALQAEGHLHATGFTDPVALHGFHLFRPAIQLVEVVQQFFGIVGNADKPLRNFFTLNHGVAAPAAAVDDLFVSQYGLVMRAPVHRRDFFVGQTLVDQLGEEPLFPAVVFRLAGG